MKSAGILDKEDKDFEGQYNFGTGTIDKGLHRGLMTALGKNLISFLTMLLPFSS